MPGLGIAWVLIAVLLDYLFIVLLFQATYYEPDVFVYYTVTFLIPVGVGLYLNRTHKKPCRSRDNPVSSLGVMGGSGSLPFAIHSDKESDGNSPQRVCNDGKQFNAFECHSGKRCIIAQCGHECNKIYHHPDRNEDPDCP